jgi:hypothetical protein
VGEGTAGPASSTMTEVRGAVVAPIPICAGARTLVAKGMAEGQIYNVKGGW